MKTIEQIREEAETLKRVSKSYLDDPIAQSSFSGQIHVLEWVLEEDLSDGNEPRI